MAMSARIVIKTACYRLSAFYSFFLCCSCVSTTEINYLIPFNYTGPVIIVFEQDGKHSDSLVEIRTRYYRIPQNGVLHTTLKRESGALRQHFFYVDQSGNLLEEIPWEMTILQDEFKNENTYIFNFIDGQFAIDPQVNSDKTYYNDRHAEKIKFISFYVGKYSDREKASEIVNKAVSNFIENYPKE